MLVNAPQPLVAAGSPSSWLGSGVAAGSGATSGLTSVAGCQGGPNQKSRVSRGRSCGARGSSTSAGGWTTVTPHVAREDNTTRSDGPSRDSTNFRFRDLDQPERGAVWARQSPTISTFGWANLKPCWIPPAAEGNSSSAVPAAERGRVDQIPSVADLGRLGIYRSVADMLEVGLPSGHFDGALLSKILDRLMTYSDYKDVQRCLGKMPVRDPAQGGVVAVLGTSLRCTAPDE